ncbi:MAG: roadblock/LC7 domain-containing protein, partial [Zoogloeaceae bacterium]|nr:roadblock/LC7 domain-containing protein [Zoogloeaceae bacterium]
MKTSPTGHPISPNPSPKIPAETRAQAARLLQQFVSEFDGIGVKGAVISTVDGFDVAMAAIPETDGSRLSALSSSISAIGDMATLEIGIGKHHESITIEGDNGYVFILNVPVQEIPMILSIAAT